MIDAVRALHQALMSRIDVTRDVSLDSCDMKQPKPSYVGQTIMDALKKVI